MIIKIFYYTTMEIAYKLLSYINEDIETEERDFVEHNICS